MEKRLWTKGTALFSRAIFTGQAELERRMASLDHARDEGVTWAALKAELEQRCIQAAAKAQRNRTGAPCSPHLPRRAVGRTWAEKDGRSPTIAFAIRP